ncbi:SIS domain-containing protein [Leifsonia sp. NPDC058292]|uniref:SIS domain-containing protein n=1 Tax=Leifsonia sp. NPDC058292 TaxID=3346428 RepID=UPI0036DD5E64
MSTAVLSTDIDTIESQLSAARTAIAERAAVTNVILTACGGSYAVMLPGEYFLNTRAGAVEAHAINAAEFTSRASRLAGEQSVVVLCSHSGTTPETVAAAEHARTAGALTVSFTNDPTSPLAQASEFVIPYQHGPEKSEAHVAPALLLRLLAGLLEAREGTALVEQVDAAVAQLPTLVPAVRDAHAGPADKYGQDYKHEPLIYTLAAGSNYGSAYSFAICLLQEMQWIHSAAIHAGEYFHGPFEVTDRDVPFIALLGLDETRGVEQRAVDFVTSHSDRVLVIDAAEFGLEVVEESLRGILAHLLFNVALRAYADALADHRGHPLSVRRYMWRMEY